GGIESGRHTSSNDTTPAPDRPPAPSDPGGHARAERPKRTRAGGRAPACPANTPTVLRVCEHTFVSEKGSPYVRFKRALATGNLAVVGSAAAELPTIDLGDALAICLLMNERNDARYE